MLRDQVWPGSVDKVLDRLGRDLGENHRAAEDQGLGPPSVQDQQNDRQAGDQRERREPAQGRDIARRLLQPPRSERRCEVSGRPKREQDRPIKGSRLLLADLSRQGQKRPDPHHRRETSNEETHFRAADKMTNGVRSRGSGQEARGRFPMSSGRMLHHHGCHLGNKPLQTTGLPFDTTLASRSAVRWPWYPMRRCPPISFTPETLMAAPLWGYVSEKTESPDSLVKVASRRLPGSGAPHSGDPKVAFPSAI